MRDRPLDNLPCVHTPPHDPGSAAPGLGRASAYRRRVLPLIVMLACAVIGLGLTLLRLFSPHALWAVQAVAFTPWAAVALLVATGLALLLLTGLLRATVVGLGLALVALHLSWQLPLYAGPVTAPPTPSKPFRLMTLNARFGQADVDRTLGLVRERHVDLLTIQEIDPAMLASLERAGLKELLPFRAGEPGAAPYGTMVFANIPLSDPHDMGAGFGTWLVTADTRLGPARILALHTFAPSGSLLGSSASRWWTCQARVREAARDADILAGDFNATRDHAPLRDLHHDGFATTAELSNAGLRETWPAGGERRFGPVPLPPLVQIDHILVRRTRWAATFTGFPDVPGTDHRAVIADLVPISSAH